MWWQPAPYRETARREPEDDLQHDRTSRSRWHDCWRGSGYGFRRAFGSWRISIKARVMVFLAAAYPGLRWLIRQGCPALATAAQCDKVDGRRCGMPAAVTSTSRLMAGSANVARVAGGFRIKGRAGRVPGSLGRPVNTKFFLLASILLAVSSLQSSARPSAGGGGGDPTKPPSEVSK